MDETKARAILKDRIWDNGRLGANGWTDWLCWPANDAATRIGLDGEYGADELEAMAWWMRNMKVS